MIHPPAGIILAGGRALRMGGGEKALLELGGRSMLDRVIDRLGLQVGRMAVSANGNLQRYAEYGLPVLRDSVPNYPGPLAGILAGLDWAAGQGLSHIVTAAADTPFFPTDMVKRLLTAARRADTPIALAATRSGGHVMLHPTFGLWPVSLRCDLREALEGGLRKVTVWADLHGAASAVFPDDAFFNINTPQDFKLAQAKLRAGAE